MGDVLKLLVPWFVVGEKELDLRVSIIPTNMGQSGVLRLLDKDNIKIGIRQLGFSEDNYKVFNQLIRRPNGIILELILISVSINPAVNTSTRTGQGMAVTSHPLFGSRVDDYLALEALRKL